jgi:hypothetical protein
LVRIAMAMTRVAILTTISYGGTVTRFQLTADPIGTI